MRITTTLATLLLFSCGFIVSTVVAQDLLSSPEDTIDAIYIGKAKPTKGAPGMPEGLAEQDFELESGGRVPSSLKPQSPAQKTPSQKPAQHWSETTQDGFQFKIRAKSSLSAVWVLKRSEQYDLIFANNAGSRVNMTIPAQQFYALKNAATDLRAPASDMSKCKDQFIQLELVEMKSHKVVQACLQAKGKDADQLRSFGNALTALVR